MNIVSLLETLVNSLIEAEDEFFKNPKDFHALEKATKASTEAFSAGFLGEVLTSVNKQICECPWRNEHYSIQRNDRRTVISSVGDVSFDCTYFKKKADGSYSYLLEALTGLTRNERFTEEAEVLLLTEALKTSYREATRVLPSKQEITKTTVMNKVHRIAEEMPLEEPEVKKEAEYLFIEADEDHVAEQHGNATEAKDNGSFISKLVYIYEAKRNVEGYNNRKELVNTRYFSGVYAGKDGNERLWRNVGDYIRARYDTDKIKRVFISGDGAAWIKSGTEFIDNALFCADKFHLMKYINQASGQMLDEKEIAKGKLWHILYSRKPKAKERFIAYTKEMLRSARNTDSIEKLQTYVIQNWSAIRRTMRNSMLNGCSAESHVSHVLSDRLSSRPMGWSQVGADRMSKLRCYERNHGRGKLIDLVRYSRKQRIIKATGTDCVPVREVALREIRKEHYNKAKSYIELIQASIPGTSARKAASIRGHLRLI